jgi:predicted nucleic acid-binding protein
VTLLVDTSVWSLAFRRDADLRAPQVEALRAALHRGDAIVTAGLIPQELLQGFAGPKARKELLEKFSALPMLVPDRTDHIDAAELRNRCRRAGVRIGTIDALIARLCARIDGFDYGRHRRVDRTGRLGVLAVCHADTRHC